MAEAPLSPEAGALILLAIVVAVVVELIAARLANLRSDDGERDDA